MSETGLTVRQAGSLELQRDPNEVIAMAIRAAKALQNVIAGKPKPVLINGEQYLEFEDWQMLGQFYGYAVRTQEARPVEVNGIAGAYARAELVDFRTGEVVGGADSYCMRDEDKWADRPWFQLASMAQTRAGAKALRNRLAWVAVLGGYRPTPAEEMESVEPNKQEHWCQVHNVAFKKRTGKDGSSWYSHKCDDGTYCNERAQTASKPEPSEAPKPAPEREPTNIERNVANLRPTPDQHSAPEATEPRIIDTQRVVDVKAKIAAANDLMELEHLKMEDIKSIRSELSEDEEQSLRVAYSARRAELTKDD